MCICLYNLLCQFGFAHKHMCPGLTDHLGLDNFCRSWFFILSLLAHLGMKAYEISLVHVGMSRWHCHYADLVQVTILLTLHGCGFPVTYIGDIIS